jgi:hypothetical protein
MFRCICYAYTLNTYSFTIRYNGISHNPSHPRTSPARRARARVAVPGLLEPHWLREGTVCHAGAAPGRVVGTQVPPRTRGARPCCAPGAYRPGRTRLGRRAGWLPRWPRRAAGGPRACASGLPARRGAHPHAAEPGPRRAGCHAGPPRRQAAPRAMPSRVEAASAPLLGAAPAPGLCPRAPGRGGSAKAGRRARHAGWPSGRRAGYAGWLSRHRADWPPGLATARAASRQRRPPRRGPGGVDELGVMGRGWRGDTTLQAHECAPKGAGGRLKTTPPGTWAPWAVAAARRALRAGRFWGKMGRTL